MNRNVLMSKKHKSVFPTANYFEYFLILASTITACISISVFASLVGIPVGITSSTVGLNFFAITTGIKKYKSIVKRTKKEA